MSLISLTQTAENAMKNEAGGSRYQRTFRPDCNPCAYQEEQPLNLHMIGAPIAQVAGA